MPGTLTQLQIDRFHSDGLLFPVTVIEPDEARAFLPKFEILRQRMTPWCASKQILKSHLVATWVHDLVRHSDILNAVESLLGPDLLCWSATFFAKPPQSAGYVGWHQDITYWGLAPADNVLTCWLALTNAKTKHGCMCVLPGSHTSGMREHDFLPGTDNMLMGAQDVTLTPVEEKRVVAAELDAGQMSIHHSRTLHGSLPNESPFWRIGLAINYISTSVRQVAADNDAGARQGQLWSFRPGTGSGRGFRRGCIGRLSHIHPDAKWSRTRGRQKPRAADPPSCDCLR